MILVTGGAGFIGANFVLDWLATSDEPVINLDKLTYAGNPDNLSSLQGDTRHVFVQGDICDRALVSSLLDKYQPRAIVHFAAESHVDRSIHGPGDFIRTNVDGTFSLLEAARAHLSTLDESGKAHFRFLHVSTDEVFGTLSPTDPAFSETTAYSPNSPYSASKAGSDHLVRAYYHTYKLPTIITNCSNNYGAFQFPEKLIPLMCINILTGKELPIYGDGKNVRDWLYVVDHCRALDVVIHQGKPGENYNIGGNNEVENISLVQSLCEIMNELAPDLPVYPAEKLITFVKDRPGHDRRYAINANKLKTEFGWTPSVTINQGLRLTVEWYLNNHDWWKPLL